MSETRNWMMVCHSCGTRYPAGVAFNVHQATCCKTPEIHVHDADRPCARCSNPLADTYDYSLPGGRRT